MAKKKRNILLSVITQTVVSLLLLAVAVTVFIMLRATRPQPARTEDAAALRRIEVMYAIPVPVRRQWQGFGTAQAVDEAQIPAQVTTVVIEIPPRIVVGATVEKGEIIARLDETDFALQQQISAQRINDIDAQLEQLELELASWTRRVDLAAQDVELAEADYQRVRDAFARKAARQREVDQLKQSLLAAIRVEVAAREALDKIAPQRSRLEALKAEQDASKRLAMKNVERCTIRSPLAGVLQDVDIEVGESLGPGQRVAHVVSLRQIEVPLRLPASARAKLAIGDEVILSAQDPSEQEWTGRVARISPTDDFSTRTLSVFVELEQDPLDPGQLAPGRFVQGRVISQRAEQRYVVPRRSILGDRVLLIEDGVVRSRPVTVDFHIQARFEELGVVAEQWAVLSDPLTEGSQVVINAARSLSEGLRVQTIPLNGTAMREGPPR